MSNFGTFYAWSPLSRQNISCPVNRAVKEAGMLDGFEAYKRCGRDVKAALAMIEAVESPKWFEGWRDRDEYEASAASAIRGIAGA